MNLNILRVHAMGNGNFPETLLTFNISAVEVHHIDHVVRSIDEGRIHEQQALGTVPIGGECVDHCNVL